MPRRIVDPEKNIEAAMEIADWLRSTLDQINQADDCSSDEAFLQEQKTRDCVIRSQYARAQRGDPQARKSLLRQFVCDGMAKPTEQSAGGVHPLLLTFAVKTLYRLLDPTISHEEAGHLLARFRDSPGELRDMVVTEAVRVFRQLGKSRTEALKEVAKLPFLEGSQDPYTLAERIWERKGSS